METRKISAGKYNTLWYAFIKERSPGYGGHTGVQRGNDDPGSRGVMKIAVREKP
jgi:hypothetical protein